MNNIKLNEIEIKQISPEIQLHDLLESSESEHSYESELEIPIERDIQDIPNTRENEPDPEPEYNRLKPLYTPTKQDHYLYKHYGDYPLEEDKLKMSLPYVEELINLQFHGTADFSRRAACILPRLDPGQEIKQIYLRINCQDPESNIKYLSELVKTIDFEIDEQRVQRYTGNFLSIISQLEGKTIIPDNYSSEIWIPIPITFHQYQAFPAYYLNNHDFRINVEFSTLSKEAQKTTKMDWASIYIETHSPNPGSSQIIPKIEMMPPVRYLWETVQYTGSEELGHGMQYVKLRLHFYGPIKSLIWNLYYQDKNGKITHPNFQLMDEAKFQTNGYDLMQCLPSHYFNSIMARRFISNNGIDQTHQPENNPNLYCYSFTQKPTWARPTGTYNFNYRDATLQMKLNSKIWNNVPKDVNLRCEIYALSYNIMELDSQRGVGFLFQNY